MADEERFEIRSRGGGEPANPDIPSRCPNGHEVVDSSRFCAECGAAVGLGSPGASGAARRLPRWAPLAAVAALAALGVLVFLLSRSGAEKTDEVAATDTSSEGLGLSPESICAGEVSILVDEFIAGDGDGPRALEAYKVYGMNDPRTQLAMKAWQRYGGAVFHEGRQSATRQAMAIITEGCKTIVASRSGSSSGAAAPDRPSTTTADDSPPAMPEVIEDAAACEEIEQGSAEEAAQCAVIGWLEDDRELAERFAESAVVEDLFSRDPRVPGESPGEFDGCQHFSDSDEEWDVGTYRCQFAGSDGGQALILYADGSSSDGYTIVALERKSAE